MAFTFGAATGDDLNLSGSTNLNLTGIQCLVAMWAYPTTLTATRRYWSSGAIFGAEIDGTTSEIRMRTDNTTDGQWVTTGAGIVTNKWHFIAWLQTGNDAGPVGVWRVWVGDAVTPPQEVTVTQTVTPVGNFVASNAYVIGNAGAAGTVAFQGDIGSFFIHASTVPNFPLGLAVSTAITQAEADRINNRIVKPLWSGLIQPYQFLALKASGSSTEYSHLDKDPKALLIRGATNPIVTNWTVNGATFTEHAPPRRMIDPNWVHKGYILRR